MLFDINDELFKAKQLLNTSNKYSGCTKLITHLCVEHLKIGSASNVLLLEKWNQNKIIIEKYMMEHQIENVFTKDVFYRNIWTLKR